MQFRIGSFYKSAELNILIILDSVRTNFHTDSADGAAAYVLKCALHIIAACLCVDYILPRGIGCPFAAGYCHRRTRGGTYSTFSALAFCMIFVYFKRKVGKNCAETHARAVPVGYKQTALAYCAEAGINSGTLVGIYALHSVYRL